VWARSFLTAPREGVDPFAADYSLTEEGDECYSRGGIDNRNRKQNLANRMPKARPNIMFNACPPRLGRPGASEMTAATAANTGRGWPRSW
jgi:hypothetical protein